MSLELRRLLTMRRSAAFGTVGDDGRPHVSMTPFAIEPAAACLVVLVSGLAMHTRHLRRDPRVSLLIVDHEAVGEPVHGLSRFTVGGEAHEAEPGSDRALALQQAYLQRFPEALTIAQLPDFRYVGVCVRDVRQVAGFGAARDVPLHEFERLLRSL